MRIGINGLGRIGRGFLRRTLGDPGIEVAAVNDVAAPAILAHLLRHDSLYGRLDTEVEAREGALQIGGRTLPCTGESDPSAIPWQRAGVDLVLECTGRFAARARAAGHLRGGARRVVISAPSPDADVTVCVGVNDDAFDPERHAVVSNASCTTNAVAVLLDVALRAFGVERVAMTTIHCVTNNQALVDAPHADPRRARGALPSMIPTTTSAAEAVIEVLPSLRGRLHALAVRVPVTGVSLVDLTVGLARGTSLDEARAAYRDAARERLAGILGYCDEPLVSADFLGDRHSAVVDGPLLAIEGDRWLKLFAWYDNECGYVERLADLVRRMARKGARG
ncbi:MAG TPA: type I glyceraldehyde-3-phosphate dehydrogenase [Candidatus Polarisedimenticolia bacterium]|jgi:glyceraldehyde 3-phosphate dehydrogenase|nr:type I glyceraldehyde-3-phosphate dehydrogenase [Candidatus Polarisedimenticolia bacterium]